jgi:glycosyltransferase involved in cell wall biosynthesis
MRIAVVLPEYRREKLRQLPWRYTHELCKYLLRFDNEVVIVTDGYPELPAIDEIDGVSTIRLRHIKHFPPTHLKTLEIVLKNTNADVVLWLMGLTSFFQSKLYKRLNLPIVALVTSPVTWRREILRTLSPKEIWRERTDLATSIVSSVVPRFLIRGTFNIPSIKRVVSLTKENTERLKTIGVDSRKLVHIQPGIDAGLLSVPPKDEIEKARAEACPSEGKFLVTYFGPPVLSRGVETLLRAIRYALNRDLAIDHIRLLLLMRTRGNEYEMHERNIAGLIDRYGLKTITRTESGFQRVNKLKSYLAGSDLIALPFKYVISDMPLGIVEALCLGKPVLSTKIDGIAELLENGRGILIQPNDFATLGETILELTGNRQKLAKYGKRARRFMVDYPKWKESAATINALLNDSIG